MDSGKQVLCFGELLLRLCPDSESNWLTQHHLTAYVGGAEANVATALARWQNPVAYCTAVPDHFLAGQMLAHLEKKGVKTAASIRNGGRVGTYYLPQGSDVKHTGIIYDRAGSAYALLKPGQINWDDVLKDTGWFHFSAICPAINADVADVCLEAVQAAAARGITISLDLNYRAKLWQYGKTPAEIMPALAEYCDVIMGNIWAAEKMLGIPLSEDQIAAGTQKNYVKQAHETATELQRRFPKCHTVANTFRFGEEDAITYYTTLFTAGETHVSPTYSAGNIVDKVGSGDCFMAGLIHGLLRKETPRNILDFATAAAYSMLFIAADSTDKSVEEIREIQLHHAKTRSDP
ncbi:MAG: sugar kinase [Mucilaginibacter polytrichastri]|nr:sugar kinase [Mucilaginibacter polytrichastri]